MSDRQMGNYNKMLDIMTAKNIKPAQGKTFSQSDVMKFCLDNFFDGKNKGREKTGAGADVITRIHDAVENQIKKNKNSEKTIKIGRGRNEVTVKYEQRAITSSWIRAVSNANADAINDYLKGQGDMVDKHNKWLVANCGYPVDSIENEAIANFNRRTSKAEKRADKLASGVVD